MEQPLFPVPLQVGAEPVPQVAHCRQADQDTRNDGPLGKAGLSELRGIAIHGAVDHTPGAQGKEH